MMCIIQLYDMSYLQEAHLIITSSTYYDFKIALAIYALDREVSIVRPLGYVIILGEYRYL